jgi:hypothetical protein
LLSDILSSSICTSQIQNECKLSITIPYISWKNITTHWPLWKKNFWICTGEIKWMEYQTYVLEQRYITAQFNKMDLFWRNKKKQANTYVLEQK